MTYKMGPKGQVVVPKAIRDALRLHPGDELVVDSVGDEVRIRRARGLEAIVGIAKGSGSLTAALEAERRADNEREERKIAEWKRRAGP